MGVILFGNGGEESTLGDSVGWEVGENVTTGQTGITVGGLGVFGAFDGFAVVGLRVGGIFLVGTNVGRLLTGLGVGFLLFSLFVGSGVHSWAEGASVGQESGEAGAEGTKVVGRVVGCSVPILFIGIFVMVSWTLGTWGLASFVLIAATPARERNQRRDVCFMVLDCC